MEMEFECVSEKRRQYIEERMKQERLFAVIGTTGDIRDQVADIAGGLRDGGVSVAEITCRSPTWVAHLDALQKYKSEQDEGVIVAVGTHTDIYSVHEAMEHGTEVVVAAHALLPYANTAAVPQERQKHIAPFEEFLRAHEREISAFAKSVGYAGDPVALMCDPVWYVRARGGIVIPASSGAPDGLKALRARGAHYQKLYPTQAKTAEQWAEVFKAVTPADDLRIVLTGGLNAQNVGEYLKVPYVAAAGMSYLAKGKDRADTARIAKECRAIVDALKSP